MLDVHCQRSLTATGFKPSSDPKSWEQPPIQLPAPPRRAAASRVPPWRGADPARGHCPGVPLCHPPLCALPLSGRFPGLAPECSPLCGRSAACGVIPLCRRPRRAPGGQREPSGAGAARGARGGMAWPVFMDVVVITFLTLPAG